MLVLSEQQNAVLDWAKNGQGSLNLIARAGCGKTSTLIELVPHLKGEIFIGAFNKKIADEISLKLKQRNIPWKQCSASTLHAAGFNAWRRMAPDVKVEGKKVIDMLYDLVDHPVDEWLCESARLYQSFTIKCVSLGKQSAIGHLSPIEDRGAWFKIIDHFNLEEDLPEGTDMDDVLDFVIEIYRKSLSLDKELIDFDDMLLAPLVHGARVWPKDWVLIDEAQDTNPARRALALKMLKPETGRLIAVGDPAQAIYGFTGADSDAMEIIQHQLNSQELPLNKTYRCPSKIVSLAQQWVPDIEALPEAPEGILRQIPLRNSPDGVVKGFWEETLSKEDVMLCRYVKPLVETAYMLLRRGVACMVEGREIGAGLIKLINRWKVTGLDALLNKVNQHEAREVQRWLSKGKEEKAATVQDACETIRVLSDKLMIDGKNQVSDLVNFIQQLFGDSQPGIPAKVFTLSTIHKSKGREWDRVYLLGRNSYMPSRWARKEWQLSQEYNLCYVAVTRAKKELVEVMV